MHAELFCPGGRDPAFAGFVTGALGLRHRDDESEQGVLRQRQTGGTALSASYVAMTGSTRGRPATTGSARSLTRPYADGSNTPPPCRRMGNVVISVGRYDNSRCNLSAAQHRHFTSSTVKASAASNSLLPYSFCPPRRAFIKLPVHLWTSRETP
jgi:hypothetical protein